MATRSLIAIAVAVSLAVIVAVVVTITVSQGEMPKAATTPEQVTDIKSTPPNRPVKTGFSSGNMFSTDEERPQNEQAHHKEKSE